MSKQGSAENLAAQKPKKYLILTSSGGGGHISAAKAKKQALLTKLATEELTKEGNDVNNPQLLKAKQEEIDKRNIIDIVDLMGLDPVAANKDKAWVPTIKAGSHELFSGKANTEKWDDLQKKGGISSVKELESLVSKQWMAEVIQGPSVYANLKAYLSENDVQEIYNTQALSTPAICQAVVEANTEQGKQLKIHSTVTEFLTDRAVHFLDPLSRVKPEHRAVLSVEVTEPPLCAPGQSQADFLTSHGVDGITFRFLSEEGVAPPVRQEFQTLDFTSTPPGPKIIIKAKEVTDQSKGELPEQDYIASCLRNTANVANNGNDFTIDKGPNDKLVTITMGSQGSSTVLSYIDKFIDDAVASPPKNGKVYLCVAAGKNEGDNSLYAQVRKRIEERRVELEKSGKKIPDSVAILPLAFQDGKHMASLLQNSDVLITRSGGMSSIEAKYTQIRNPNRRVYVHSEEIIPNLSTFPSNNYDAIYEGLLSGTVRWEGGNAEYLMKHIKASLGSPETVNFGFGEQAQGTDQVKSLFHMAYDKHLDINHLKQIEDLIISGSNPNLKFPGGSSLIDHCNDFGTKKLLVEYGAKLTKPSLAGLNKQQIQELQNASSKFKTDYSKGTSKVHTAFKDAITNGDVQQVKGLLHNFSTVKDHKIGKQNLVEFVIEQNKPEVLKVLMDKGLKIDAKTAYKLLHEKDAPLYAETLKLMVREQVLHPIDDKLPHMQTKQTEELVDTMYEPGNKYGNTELHKAVHYKNKGEAEFQKQFGARTFEQVLNDNVESVNKQNIDGKTPLTITNDRQIRRDLVKLEADLKYLPDGFAKDNKEEVRQLSELRVECNELIKDTRSLIIQEYKKHKNEPEAFAYAIVDRITKLYKDSPEKLTGEQATKIFDYCESVHKELATAKKPEKQTIGTKIVNKIRAIVGITIFDKFSKDASIEVSKSLTTVLRNVESKKDITGDLDKSLKVIKEKLVMHKTNAGHNTRHPKPKGKEAGAGVIK